MNLTLGWRCWSMKSSSLGPGVGRFSGLRFAETVCLTFASLLQTSLSHRLGQYTRKACNMSGLIATPSTLQQIDKRGSKMTSQTSVAKPTRRLDTSQDSAVGVASRRACGASKPSLASRPGCWRHRAESSWALAWQEKSSDPQGSDFVGVIGYRRFSSTGEF